MSNFKENLRYNSLYLNNYYWFVLNSFTLFQTCLEKKIYIPRFCYHSLLEIAGNCRMCLVENKKGPKPLASCASGLMTGLVLYTKTKVVKKAREGVLSYLLANHPLDCPICDQGGECDLQDQTMVFGGDISRFYEINKKSTENKNFSFIKMSLNRCIYCGRCSRFLEGLVGNPIIHLLGRGASTEISTYDNSFKYYNDFLFGNVIDLCPVGALLSKPYSFLARSWEIISIESISVFDSLGSNIKIDFQGTNILRVIPRINSFLNEEWICDKTRFFYINLNVQRLTKPLLLNFYSKFINLSWFSYFIFFKNFLMKNLALLNYFCLKSIVGPFLDFEGALSLKSFFNKIGNLNFHNYKKNINKGADLRSQFFFQLKSLDWKESNLCVLVNTNPRFENPVLWLKLRFAFKFNNFTLYLAGFFANLNYFFNYMGNSLVLILKFLEFYFTSLKNSVLPFFFFGFNFNFNDNILYNYFSANQNNCNIKINKLTLYSSSLSLKELSMSPLNSTGQKNIIYNLGCEVNFFNLFFDNKSLLIYQGSNGNFAANFSDVILPAKNFIEKSSTFLNVEAWVQTTGFTLYKYSFDMIKNDSKIFRATGEFLFTKFTIFFSNYYYLNKLHITNFFDAILSFYFNIKSKNKILFFENFFGFGSSDSSIFYLIKNKFLNFNLRFSKCDLNYFSNWLNTSKWQWI